MFIDCTTFLSSISSQCYHFTLFGNLFSENLLTEHQIFRIKGTLVPYYQSSYLVIYIYISLSCIALSTLSNISIFLCHWLFQNELCVSSGTTVYAHRRYPSLLIQTFRVYNPMVSPIFVVWYICVLVYMCWCGLITDQCDKKLSMATESCRRFFTLHRSEFGHVFHVRNQQLPQHVMLTEVQIYREMFQDINILTAPIKSLT